MKSNSKNERRAPAKSRRFLAMFICAAVIAIAAAATALYLSKPEPASAEEAFFGAVNASGPYQAPPGAQGLGGFYENWRLGRIADGFASSSSDAAVELRASAAPSLYPAQLSAIVGSLLQDLSLTVSYKNDRETQKSLSSLAVNVSGKKLGAIDVLYDGAGRIGVSSPEIRPAPIIVSTDDLPGVLAAATGLEAPAGGLPQRGGPEMGSLLARLQALPGELALSREEYDSVMGPYFAMAEEMLGGDSFAVSEGATVDGAVGESYAMASAAISGADMKALALAALDRAQGDEALLGLIQDKYAAAYEFMASAAGAVPFAAVPDAGALLPSPESARGLAKAALLNARAAVEAYAPAAGAVFCADIYLDGDDRIR
ncbi:MAG: hypothetical protein LBL83_13310, partial [Clostridiales bacterium]|nr:hypothetical protein [Clostridiales bacterium]